MLKKAPIRNINLDENLLADMRQLDRSQLKLAAQQGVSTTIQKLASKAIEFSTNKSIETAVVFLTEKKCGPALQKVLQWLDIDQNLDEKMIFGGKYNVMLRNEDQLPFEMHLFHFDHYPLRTLPECRKALNIVVFDADFGNSYPNWELAMQVLGMDAPACLIIDLSDHDRTPESVQTPKIKAVYTKYLRAGDLSSSVQEVLDDIELVQAIYVARLRNHLLFTEYVQGSIVEDLLEKEKRWKGKSILAFKKEQQLQGISTDRQSNEVGALKPKIDSGYKQLIGYVEGKTDTFDTTAPKYRQLEEEIVSFLGFLETKSSRYLTLKISEGAIRDKLEKANLVLEDFFESILAEVNSGIKKIEEDIKNQFIERQLDVPDIETQTLDSHFTKQILVLDSAMPDKPYEKQIMSKGIGSLLMELRTPLFMLMPFMMIFALFASLVGDADKGNINEAVLFHDNRPVIAINHLPESRNNEFGRFIDELENYNKPGKGVFEKSIQGELSTEPQLAVRLIEVPQAYGNTTKTEQRLDYFFDSKAQTMYLYLNPIADRNFVIDKLYDPSLELLTIPASTRRGFGIGGLIRFLSGLRDYRYVIFIGLFALITWFIITRKKSMDAELAFAKNKERSKLNSDLRLHVDKTIKLNLQKWRSKLVDELNNRQITLVKKTEKALNQNTEIQRQHNIKEKKIVQKRTATLKMEKTKLANFKTELRKLHTKCDQLKTKLKRMLRQR